LTYIDKGRLSIKKSTEVLLEASREAGLEVSTEETKYMFVSRRQNHNLLIANEAFENVARYKHMGTRVKKSKLHSRRNYEQLKFRKCFPTFSSESFVFASPL
jgi:hypothetical protein